MDEVVIFDQVYFSYPNSVNVLQNVNIAVAKGEFIGIIGPNGGGKTTLLKLILGFLKPNSGKIEVFGKPTGSAANMLAYVPQSLRFDKQFPISVLDVVLTGRLSHLPWYGRYRHTDRQRALEALDRVKLLELKNRPFGTLSGGQAQRALIARALASNPHMILLDEPTASVDPQAESEIYDILESLQGKMTILMVTHDLQAAIDRVERVICVQSSVISLLPQEVCEHFALGLYHTPLISQIGDYSQ